MKIKVDFITNSSSTNFIIISKKEIVSAEDLVDVLGVKKDSPIYYYIYDFCQEIYSYIDSDYFQLDNSTDKTEKLISEEFGKDTLNKYRKLSNKGYHTYISRAGTETNELMTFFAFDYFEIDNSDLYINGKQCVY